MPSSRFHPPPSAILIAGPTAVGKSEVALHLAEAFGGEIISVDSMQVYRGLDIGTAKPTVAERQRVPHHLLDVVDLQASFDAAQFVRHAQAAVEEIRARRKVPILCGGTGLYFKAFLEGLGEAPPADPALRAELEKTPMPELLCELAEADPRTFEKIDRQNPRRVIRAIEVIRQTGQPFSTQRATWQRDIAGTPLHSSAFFGLSREREDLHRRIEVRVDNMFASGLIAETEQLLHRGLGENRTALQAIGYRQAVEYLRGEHSLAETKELVKVRTRQFAKRQVTWLRGKAALTWLPVAPAEVSESIASRVAESLRIRP